MVGALPGGQRHLDFRRLIKATERTLEEGPLASASLDERAYALELNRFGVYVTTLREQLSELYTMDVENMPVGTLQDYSLRLDALERTLFTRQQELRAHQKQRASKPEVLSEAVSGPVTPGVRRRDSPVPPIKSGLPVDGLFKAEQKGQRGEGANREEKEALSRQKEEQHRLKVQLEDLVSSLKASTTLIYSNLKDQNQVLDKTGDAAVKNLEGLEQDIKKTEEQLRRAWSNSFTSCLMIIVVLATFVATFLFMRLFPKRRFLLW